MKQPSEKQLGVLALIGTFGYLSTREIAKLNWPQNEAHSAHSMAQDAVSKLAKAGLVLAKDPREQPGMKSAPLPKSGVTKAYILTKRGAEILNDTFVDEFIETPAPADGKLLLWFAANYKVSMADHVTRAPLIDLLHEMMSSDPTLHAIGKRGASRNVLGLQHVSHFDAVLVDDQCQFVFGVYLAHQNTAQASDDVTKLIRGPHPFLLAADSPKRLAVLQKWRAERGPKVDAHVWSKLPAGVEA